MNTVLNKYFVSVFTYEDLTSVPEAEQVFRGREDEKLLDINITREIINEGNKLKIGKSPGLTTCTHEV